MGSCGSREKVGAKPAEGEKKVLDSHIRRASAHGAPDKPVSSAVNIKEYYDLNEELGQGGFGRVVNATEKATGLKWAVKILSKASMTKLSEEERKKCYLKSETELMDRVRGHPNVVELHETYEDKKDFYMVMELCTGGELMDRIKSRGHFSEKVVSMYFQQMLLGVQHCHKNNVAHRDLKPENFLFKNKEDVGLMLTDFGLSTYVETPESRIRDACGSAYYIAPEVFTRNYTLTCDIWSLGIILYLLLVGRVPFGHDATVESQVYRAIQTEELSMDGREWTSVSAAARELVRGLLEKDPAKRYTIEQALKHPWVQGEAAMDTPIDRSVVLSMYSFNARNKFKKEALKLIAGTLSAAGVQKLRQTFNEIDTDNTGTITHAELSDALSKMGDLMGTGGAKVDVEKLMSELDSDGDGTVNYEEFLVATADRMLVQHQNNIWWAFCEYDRDNSGSITADELVKVMKHEDPEKVKGYIKEYDLDHDGRINYEEFMRMVLPKDLKYRISRYG